MAGNEKKADISMTGNKSGKPSIDGKTLKIQKMISALKIKYGDIS